MTQRRILVGTVMLMAALGLTGCAKSSSAPATNESHVRSARVAKSSSHKSHQHESSSSLSSATTRTSSSAAAQQSNANQSSQSATQQSNANQAAATTNNGQAAATNANSHSEQHVQLGLGDVAVWTENGVTHHVDSDGMDRQTTNGSSTIHYSDWSGQLPQGVQVQHN